jgi:hypothetical protein
MAHAGHYHGDAGGVGRCDDFVVTHRAARLDDGGGAGRDQRPTMPSANGKKASEATTEPLASAPSMPAAFAASMDLR